GPHARRLRARAADEGVLPGQGPAHLARRQGRTGRLLRRAQLHCAVSRPLREGRARAGLCCAAFSLVLACFLRNSGGRGDVRPPDDPMRPAHPQLQITTHPCARSSLPPPSPSLPPSPSPPPRRPATTATATSRTASSRRSRPTTTTAMSSSR